MKEIKLTVDGKEITLTEEQIKSLGLNAKESPKYNLLGQPMIEGDCIFINTDVGINSKDRYMECDVSNIEWCMFSDGISAAIFDKKQQALKELWDWKTINDGEFVPDWKNNKQVKYSIHYCYYRKSYLIEGVMYTRYESLLPYFSTDDIANNCITECKSQLDILFDIN